MLADNRGSNESEFEQAASRVATEPEPATPLAPPNAPVPAPAGEVKEAAPAVRFVVSPGLAAGVAELLPYGLLSAVHHPAWALTDEQVAALGPKWQPVLQRFADKYAPAWLARIHSEDPELRDLVIALGLVTLVKWRDVGSAKAEQQNAARGKEAAASNVRPIDRKPAETEPAPAAGDFLPICPDCGARGKLSEHDCPNAQPEKPEPGA
ncbi:MAG: hypothetical protein A4C66_11595 [Nitrospira sp. HN-bin3]|uniref:hypothetical protein n=1 Tax=Nitrospira cf. moscoviensis SBR1015 TaxID=96242 RepID=UPI000A0B1CC8|nr:hypothetical protein [Nitrospira cf. moscoviensis SBR1015]OQW38604.1 MAG: hypothetical protein A4C66_11595 [Nitrospira sp. HN-bin3]